MSSAASTTPKPLQFVAVMPGPARREPVWVAIYKGRSVAQHLPTPIALTEPKAAAETWARANPPTWEPVRIPR